jgi:hypothetical protein
LVIDSFFKHVLSRASLPAAPLVKPVPGHEAANGGNSATGDEIEIVRSEHAEPGTPAGDQAQQATTNEELTREAHDQRDLTHDTSAAQSHSTDVTNMPAGANASNQFVQCNK